MKTILNFFSEVENLKKIKRKGISFYGVKNPDSCAEHNFRVGLMILIFGKNINQKKAFKINFVHNLSKIKAGDITPYDGFLPQKKSERDQFVKKWRRLETKQKESFFKKKTKKENKALKEIIKDLPQDLKKEILLLQEDYTQQKTKEGNFVFQLDKLENLLEAYECWKEDDNFPTRPWWEHIDEVIDNKELLQFTKQIEKRELKEKLDKSEMSNIFDFLIKVGNLKKMPRNGWVINNIKNPESIADHTFRASFMGWILGKKKELNVERIIKIGLIHDLCEVYAGDTTPYDSLISKNNLKDLTKKWPRFSKKERIEQSKKKFKKEEEGLEKLIKDLPKSIKIEIKNLWIDYEKGLTPEGRFFKQVDKLESLLQSSEYWRDQKKPPQKPWWDWAREYFDDSLLLELVEEINNKFHK